MSADETSNLKRFTGYTIVVVWAVSVLTLLLASLLQIRVSEILTAVLSTAGLLGLVVGGLWGKGLWKREGGDEK